jgi:hypothetical protein
MRCVWASGPGSRVYRRPLNSPTARLAGDGDGIAGAAAQALLLQSSKVDRPGVDPALLAKPALIAADALPPFGEDRFESVADALAAAGAGAGGPAGCGVVEGLLGVGPDPGYADWDQLEPEPYAVSALTWTRWQPPLAAGGRPCMCNSRFR